MRSLLNRLSLVLSLALLAAAATQALMLRDFPQTLVETYVRSRLEHDAELLYARLRGEADPARRADALAAGAGPIYELPLSGHYYRVTLGEEVLRSRSLWDEDLSMPAQRPGALAVERQSGPAGQQLLVYGRQYQTPDGPVAIAVAEDLAELDATIADFTRHALLGFGLVLVLLLVLMRKLLARGLAPLDAAVTACRRLESGEVAPIDTPARAVPSEVQPMLDAVNRLVRLHGQRLTRIRHALGNVSHALKTPLAVLTQEAEDLRARGDTQAAATLEQQIDIMRACLERELRRARLAGGGPPGAGFAPGAQLGALAGALRRLHGERVDIQLDTPSPDRALPLDREDLLELFGNLLDNACKWATRRVHAEFHLAGGALHFRIEDDGPGVPAALLPELGRPGLRADESRPGHGLGLAIVSDIVAQYGGELHFSSASVLGGLRVEGQLPLPGDLA